MMSEINELGLENNFAIDGAIVASVLQWAKDVAKINVAHLRSCLAACGEFCSLCVSLSLYYDDNLADCRRCINEGEGDPIVNKSRLLLLEIGSRLNNLSGYLALLQMDAMVCLINLLEAKSDVERLMICKNAYTIIYDAQDKGLFRVVSKEMKDLPEDVLPKERRLELWKGIKSINRLIISGKEAERVRNTIGAHKSPLFTEQITAYKQCEFGKCVASMFSLMKIAWIIQETLGDAQQKLNVLEGRYIEVVKDRMRKWEKLKAEFDADVASFVV